VSGTIAASAGNGLGVAGVAFGAKIVPVRALGRCGGFTSDIADAIVWSAGGSVPGVPDNLNQARVLNLSLGGPGTCETTTQSAVNIARSHGAVVVVSAGNDNTDAGTASPANCQGVVTVAAVGRTGGKASYSNYGTVVALAAPGGDTGAGILSTLNSGTTTPAADIYGYYMGTSQAAPHVAGVAALMLSQNPYLTPEEVATGLRSTAYAFPALCAGCGTGILDASAAVTAAIISDLPPVPEVEPNDTGSTANVVTTSGTLVAGTMATSLDNDFFTVQVPPGSTLSAMLTIADSTSDYDLYAFDSAGNLVASSNNPAGSIDALTNTNTSGAPAVYYLAVHYYTGATGPSGQYTLKLSW
jgi:serine protease